MAKVPLLKTICNEDFKNKVSNFCKKKGVTESATIRRAMKELMDKEGKS